MEAKTTIQRSRYDNARASCAVASTSVSLAGSTTIALVDSTPCCEVSGCITAEAPSSSVFDAPRPRAPASTLLLTAKGANIATADNDSAASCDSARRNIMSSSRARSCGCTHATTCRTYRGCVRPYARIDIQSTIIKWYYRISVMHCSLIEEHARTRQLPWGRLPSPDTDPPHSQNENPPEIQLGNGPPAVTESQNSQ